MAIYREFYQLAETVIDNDEWAEDVSASLQGTELKLLFDVETSKFVLVETN